MNRSDFTADKIEKEKNQRNQRTGSETHQSEEQKEEKVKEKDGLKGFMGKHQVGQYSHNRGAGGEERKQASLCENATAESFPNVGMEINIHVNKMRYKKS